MGLDMYFKERGAEDEFFYFRKHADLNGWLQEQWMKTQPDGVVDPSDFNCNELVITQEILDGMKNLALSEEKPHYEGFFWGESSPEDWERTLQLCDEIQNKLECGIEVVYTPWW